MSDANYRIQLRTLLRELEESADDRNPAGIIRSLFSLYSLAVRVGDYTTLFNIDFWPANNERLVAEMVHQELGSTTAKWNTSVFYNALQALSYMSFNEQEYVFRRGIHMDVPDAFRQALQSFI